MARRQAKSNNSLWLTTGILLLIFIAILFYLEHRSLQPIKATPVAKKSTHIQSSTKPKFDFYNVLSQNQTRTQESKSTATKSAPVNLNKLAIPAPNTTINKPAISYTLRVASLKNYADADRIKAELTLLGYNVSIQKVTIHNTTWNRVNLGPYTSLNAAQSAQNELKKNHYNSVILKTKSIK